MQEADDAIMIVVVTRSVLVISNIRNQKQKPSPFVGSLVGSLDGQWDGAEKHKNPNF
jgi:hypothetical protein